MPSQSACFFPSWGDASVRVAVLDGPVDLTHPCFRNARIELAQSVVSPETAPSGDSAAHGTHVTSVLFGQHGSDVAGLVPNCSGLVIPIFGNEARSASQLDLARAIEMAADRGAHVINISGGQLTDFGEADVWLHNAIRLCGERNILVVAAAGNDGCACLHVPAALPNVLAVGAVDRRGQPMEFSNWGDAYRTSGVMAPGEQILGAKPGGGTTRANGTSFATPLVAGAAALLLSLQLAQGQNPDPLGIRRLLLETALPCDGGDANDRCLAGKLNLAGAFDALTGSRQMTYQSTARGSAAVTPQCACEDDDKDLEAKAAATDVEPQTIDGPSAALRSAAQPGANPAPAVAQGRGTAVRAANPAQGARLSAIAPSQSPDDVAQADGVVYAIGVLGYDFGTEARRDSFKQQMPRVNSVPANPYDARQMVDFLRAPGYMPSARSLIWTLNLELTPIYAIEPSGPFAADVYAELVDLLGFEILHETDRDFVERVSIPGLLTGKTVKLFSGQVVPVIEPPNTRGLYGWRTTALVDDAINAVRTVQEQSAAPSDPNAPPPPSDAALRETLAEFLNRIYYDLRNLGKTSHDRALNFASTNAFQAVTAFSDALVRGMQLDDITVDKSPFCRMDSDCWDIKLKFFDPNNNQRAKRVLRYTVDVSDVVPVLMGEPRSWTQAN